MNIKKVSPVTVAAAYVAIAIVWFSLSNYIIFNFLPDTSKITATYFTSLVFVGLSSFLLFYIFLTNDKAIQTHTHKYQNLFDNNPQPMWIYDPDTLNFLAVNNAALSQYGYTKEEFSRMTKKDIRRAEDMPAFELELGQIKSSLREVNTARHKKKDGTLIHVELTSRSLLFEGKPAILVLVNNITEKIEALHKLRHQEQLLHSIFNKTPTGICITDDQGYYEQVNDAYCRLYAYTQQELIGKHFTLVVPPQHKQMMQQRHDQFITEGSEMRGEWTVVTKYGEKLCILADAALIEDANHRKHKATFVRDISQQKKAEAELLATLTELQNYKTALDKSALVSVTDLKGNIIYVNDIFCQTAKYTSGELIGQNHRIINSRYHSKAFWVNMWKTISTGNLWRGEIRNRAKDGTYYWVDTIINPVFDQKGRLTNYLSIRYEITDRKNSEEKIKASERALKEAQEIAHIGNWEYNLQEQRANWSDEVFRIHGFPKEGGVPAIEQLQQQIHPEDLPYYLEVTTKAIQEGIPYTIDIRIRMQDGQEKYINLIGNPVRNEDGQISKYYGTTMDINERKLAEKHLQEQNEELKKINTQLDRFVYSAGHDLRAPLVSVLGLINIAQMDPAPVKKDEYMELMRRSINKLDNFIKDIIHFSRNTRTDIGCEKIDFKTLIQDILDSLSNFKGIEAFEAKIDVIDEMAFHSDTQRLSVIFNNLLSNAIRYSDPYKPHLYVHITVTTTPTEAHIIVADNGIGIEEEHQQKVFNMFYRATESKSGSGLGLYIVKETVTMLEGNIQLTSRAGVGTTFTLTIPNRAGVQQS